MVKKTIQEQLIDARRDQILDAAAKVFAEKGYHPTTIKDIAREAAIADGTIYNYFENKMALLLGIFGRMQEAAMREVVPQVLEAPDFPSFLGMLLQQPLLALREGNFALFRIIVSEIMVNEDLRAQYGQQIFEPMLALDETVFPLQAAKYGVTLTEPKLMVRAIGTMVLGLIMAQILGNRQPDEAPDDLPGYFVDLLLNQMKP